MKRTLLIIGFLALANLANSQTLKTYTGNYEGGSATYQYYENKDYERIFQGTFSYKSKAYDFSYFEQEITGNFKENLKNGLWTAKKTRTVTDYRIGELKITEILSGKYENGKKVGQWTYKVQQKLNDKSEAGNTTYNFKDNILVGSLSSTTLKGQLNDDGLYIGNWTMTTKEYREEELEYIAEFKNNIFLKLLVRQTSDGKILVRYDNSDLVNQIPDTSTQQILTINGQRYELQSCSELDSYSDDDNKYFSNFTEAINKKIGDFDKPLKDITLGSTDFIIKAPQVLIQKELTYAEKKAIEEEQRKKEAEEKFDAAVKNGNDFFETKKYKLALAEYNSANAIEISNDVSAKIKATQKEIDRIDSLQKLRLETYSYLKSKYETIAPEMTSLKLSLEDKKKVYGKNYELCMNLLNSKFPSYFSSVNAMFNANKTTGLKIEDTWNETDQDALDLLTKFKDEFKQYEKFHYEVKTAFETENKDQLKLLKSSDDPKEIISKF